MKLRETMICWNTTGRSHRRGLPGYPWAKAGPHPDRSDWSRAYLYNDGASDLAWRGYSADERLLRLFVLFAIMVLRDGVPATDAHKAMLEIDEYREALPADVPRTPESMAELLAWHADRAASLDA